MINLIGILIMLILEALVVSYIILKYVDKANRSDEEVLGRDIENGKKTEVIKRKNFIIKQQNECIKELVNENKELKRQLKRANNKKL